MSDKTEKATPHKLKKAKQQGQVSKSTELNTCVFILVLLATSTALWASFMVQIEELSKELLSLTSHLLISVESIGQLQRIILSKMIHLFLPFSVAGVLAIVLSTLAQTGFVWSGVPLTPDFKRLSIAKGFTRLFSSKMLFEAGKNSLKLGLVFSLLCLTIRHECPTLLTFIVTSPHNAPVLLVKLVSKLLLQLMALLLALAMIDKLYTRWKFSKDNRMSKQEVKDEYRQREGDPKIKSKIKQLQQQQRQKTASLEHVKTADVVITNPTHLAIALKYDRGLMPAPKVVCKVQGD